jgi:excisionase family DNA binding protein
MTQANGNPAKERRKENVIDLLTLKEVADICRVSTATVKYWVAMRKISAVKLGKHPLVKREELLRFIKASESAGGSNQNHLNSKFGHGQR